MFVYAMDFMIIPIIMIISFTTISFVICIGAFILGCICFITREFGNCLDSIEMASAMTSVGGVMILFTVICGICFQQRRR